jgi:hypothetical protein
MAGSVGAYEPSPSVGAYEPDAAGGGGADLASAVHPRDAMPRDLQSYHDFISANGGTAGRSLQDDYREALALALGYTAEQALTRSIDDLWNEYAEDRGLA